MNDLRSTEFQYPPEGLTLHVLICQAVVGERLIPCRVAGVSQGLCAQLVGLLDAGWNRTRKWKYLEASYHCTRSHTSVVSAVLSQGVSTWCCFPSKGFLHFKPVPFPPTAQYNTIILHKQYAFTTTFTLFIMSKYLRYVKISSPCQFYDFVYSNHKVSGLS